MPAITFVASANCVVFEGGTPIFADVLPDSLLIDPASVESRITSKTKAILAVDYAGQPCDYEALQAIADRHRLMLLTDGCHALGAEYRGQRVGTIGRMTAFSFHPVKHITTGEGGMVTTDDDDLAKRLRMFRSHGISSDFRERAEKGTFAYEMIELGFNYRLSDLQCALGSSQLKKLPRWVARRNELARLYREALAPLHAVSPLVDSADVRNAYHLFVVRVAHRNDVHARLRAAGIGANVHYLPVHLHPFYAERFSTKPGLCPVAEAAYETILSVPMFPAMTGADVSAVVAALRASVTP